MPENPRVQAAVAHLLGQKYDFSYQAVPGIRARLGLNEEAVQQTYQRLYHEPLETIFAPRTPLAGRLRWAWAALAGWLESLPPFWTAFALTLTETVGAGILALPIALADVGPLTGLANVLIIAYMAEAVALGGGYWSQGDVAAAQQAFAKAQATAQECGYRLLAVPATCYVGQQQVKQGKLREAFETYREALEGAIGPGGRPLPVAGFPSVELGDLLREWNDLETASRYLSQGVELCVQLGQADILAEGYVALARLQLAQGDPGGALNTLQDVEQIAQTVKIDPWIICWMDDVRLRVWLSAGDLAAAIRWTQASGLRADGELSYQHDLHHLNLARVLVARVEDSLVTATRESSCSQAF